jgi:hypothetical protein
MPIILATQEAEIRRIMGLKPSWANSLQDLILEKENHKKRADGAAQGVGPEFIFLFSHTQKNNGLVNCPS